MVLSRFLNLPAVERRRCFPFGIFDVVLLLVFLLLPVCAGATAEYAGQTGRPCSDCHIDPSGGGMLTAAGESFRNDLRIKGLYRPLTKAQRIIRFIVGFLHTMTALIWFGAILYVHILLKPAYAARGLPRGELILGWSSIIIMTVTGTLLSITRVPSWQMLFSTRFGLLLVTKVVLFLIMATTAAIATFVIGPRMKRLREAGVAETKAELTDEELSRFDGNGERPAYVAYRGTVYDVTNSRFWKDGVHVRKHRAGGDLTDILGQAPHGDDRITRMPVVGRLVAAYAKPVRPLHQRVFYFMAYMNLVLIFLIVFVISLWRWW